jgi:hypothetical protein
MWPSVTTKKCHECIKHCMTLFQFFLVVFEHMEDISLYIIAVEQLVVVVLRRHVYLYQHEITDTIVQTLVSYMCLLLLLIRRWLYLLLGRGFGHAGSNWNKVVLSHSSSHSLFLFFLLPLSTPVSRYFLVSSPLSALSYAAALTAHDLHVAILVGVTSEWSSSCCVNEDTTPAAFDTVKNFNPVASAGDATSGPSSPPVWHFYVEIRLRISGSH